MKPFFTAKDFGDLRFNQAPDQIETWAQMSARIANAKLEREGKVVFNDREINLSGKWWEECEVVYGTHKALLVQVEKIEPGNQEPLEAPKERE